SESLPRALAAAAGRPLIQTSANRSGEPAALNGAAVAHALGDDVDLLLDAGRSAAGRSSTVVKCDERTFDILREGAVPTPDILRAATDLYLAVCTGNLCRSPLAEALLRRETARLLGCDDDEVVRHGFRFASFGIMAMAGHPATDHSVVAGRDLGVDLSGHRSRPFSIGLVREARRIFTMARGHRDFLEPYFCYRRDELQPLRPDGKDIHDPYGRPFDTYRRVARLIERACRQRAEGLLSVEASS
ncbi:MAG: Sua5/YciO/YrdC/YwlC family protein, partial [Planctomycetota bacterium]